MYRPQNQSRFCDSSYHQQNPFFRQTITIIDECTKLMKDDRIFLRNKIKDYLKDLKENRHKDEDWENEQMQILLQIFVQANKKKSLNKIQKGDKVMDWLQIKLRKFIDNNKKERHKKEVESFRRLKALNPKKQMESQVYYEKSLEKSREFPATNGHKFMDQINKLSFNLEPKKKTTIPKYSLSKSNEKSPTQSRRKPSKKETFSNLSFHKQFDYLKKSASKEKETIKQTSSSLIKNKFAFHQPTRPLSSQLTKLNKSLDSHKYGQKHNQRKPNNREKIEQNFLKNKNIKDTPIENELTKHEIDKLTQLFTHHLNAQDESKKNLPKHTKQIQFLCADKNAKQTHQDIKPSSRLQSEPSSERQSKITSNNQARFEASSQKIQEMLKNSKEIHAEYEQSQQNSFKYQIQPHPQKNPILKSASNEDLFTPPDFLAECRKYMFSSNKKKTDEDLLTYEYEEKYREPYKQTTFSNILSDQKEKTIEKRFLNQFGVNETTSQNASANISTNKPQSEVHFQYKNVSISSIQSLLLQIFKFSHKATLDRYQLGEIMSKSNPQIQQLFQKYCDVLSLQSNSYSQKLVFDFVGAVKYFYTLGKILQSNKQYFCIFLTQILDIRKKGYIDDDDIQSFFQSLESSQLDASILNSIHMLLSSVFRSSCEVQGGSMMTHWSIYYLELKGDKHLIELKQLLNKFEFQLDQQIDQ